MRDDLFQELSQTFGTPLYVLDQTLLENTLNELNGNLKSMPIQTSIAYPYKTNHLRCLCEFLHSRNIGAEISSQFELEMALNLEVAPNWIVYNSLYKSANDLVTAFKRGCKVNIDNFEEFRIILTLVETGKIKEANVGIRVSSNTGSNWDKFGFQLTDEANEIVLAIAKSRSINLIGLHAHRSNIFDLFDYEEHINGLFQFARSVIDAYQISLKYIDIGSGFAIRNPSPKDRKNWSVPEIEDYLAIVLKLWKYYDLENLELIIEPGRKIAAPSMFLLTKIVSIKKRFGKKLVIVDAGGNLLPGVDIYKYIFQQLQEKSSNRKGIYDIHGCLCDSFDILGTDIELFSPNVGDLLIIPDVGGYDISRSFFWQLPRPPVIWIESDSKYRLVKKQEDHSNIW